MRGAYLTLVTLAVLWGVYNLMVGIWGFGVVVGEYNAATSCTTSTYWYLVVRVIFGIFLGGWALATNWRDSTWDPRLDFFEFFAVLIIFGLWIWETVNLSTVSNECYTEMNDNWPWVWYTAITVYSLDIILGFFFAILGCCVATFDYDDYDGYYAYRRRYHYISEPHRSHRAHITHPIAKIIDGMRNRTIYSIPLSEDQEHHYCQAVLSLR